MEPLITKAQQIKDILEPIPAELFITGMYQDLFEEERCCALGHIHKALTGKDAVGDGDGFGARKITEAYLKQRGLWGDISIVNNRIRINGYTEESIKDRVMHLVNDMIRDGY